MVSEQHSGNGVEISEYEKFGLYPYKALRDIVVQLASGEYKDLNGNAMIGSAAFQELERMAYEPPIPDAVTEAVAGTIYHLENAGYKNKGGPELANDKIVSMLKLMNVRKMFRSHSEEALKLLQQLEGSNYSVATETGTKELKNDPAFQNLRTVIKSEGQQIASKL